MSLPLFIFIVALVLVIVFYKDAKACIYFVVITDIFLRIISYLKANIIKDSVFSFLNVVPADVSEIIRSFDLGVVTEILIFIYVVIYIVFEIFIVKSFIKRKF